MIYKSTKADKSIFDNIKSEHVIPRYASLNQMEYFVLEAAEAEYTNLVKDLGINEINYVATHHTEVVYEKADIEAIIKKVKEWFVALWAKIKGFYEMAITKLNDYLDKFKKKIAPIIDDNAIKRGLKSFADIKKGYSKRVHTFYADRSELSKIAADIVSKFAAIKKLDFAASQDVDKLSLDVDKIIKSLPGNQVLKGFSSENLKNAIAGPEVVIDATWVTRNYEAIYKNIVSSNTVKKEIPDTFKKLKKEFEDIHKVASAALKSGDAAAMARANLAKDVASLLMKISSALVSLSAEASRNDLSICGSVILALTSKKTPKAESATVSTSESVSALFNW